jgi:hypothetical protein
MPSSRLTCPAKNWPFQDAVLPLNGVVANDPTQGLPETAHPAGPSSYRISASI